MAEGSTAAHANVPGMNGPMRLGAALAGLALLGTATSAGDLRQVRIATEGAHPPFNFVEANGEPAGFEIELGRALCEAARLSCVFVVHEWEGMIKGLLARNYDAVMASMAVTPRRKLKIAFSQPYYRIPASFIARKEDTDLVGIGPKDLAGKSIGVAAHGELLAYLQAHYPQSEIRTFDKVEDANLDLLTDRIDLVFGDKLTLTNFLQSREGSCCKLVGDVAGADPALGEGVAIGLRPEDVPLKNAFDAAIARLKADGTYDRIRAKYVAFDLK